MIKLILALAAIVVALVVGAFVVAVRGTDDDTPDALRACVQQTDAVVVHGEDGLGALRRDLVLKTPPRLQRLRIGDNDGALLRGTGYGVLVLRARKSPPLSGDVALRVLHHADAYPVVAVEPGSAEGLRGCARSAR